MAAMRKHAAFCLVRPVYGRPGKGSRKARRCLAGLSTLVTVAHPIESGLAVHINRYEDCIK